MSKLMTRLDKLSQFKTRNDEAIAKIMKAKAEHDQVNTEFNDWVTEEFKIKPNAQGQIHLSEILKTALETTIEIVMP